MSIDFELRKFRAHEIAEITGGVLYRYGNDADSRDITGIATDSREVKAGTMFCAICGQNVDGHDYIPVAVGNGAACVLCEKEPVNAEGDFCAVVVEDTIKAIGKLAAYYRGLSRAKFVAVTGSVGKTTTKEFISAVLSAKYRTHKSKGNQNNELGLPLSIFGISPKDQVVVLEMGMSALGEIEYMTKIARPDIAVITNIGTSHLASLGTRENICRAKMEIREGLENDSRLILNGDEPLLVRQWEQLGKRPVLISIHNHEGDFRAVNIRQKSDCIVYDMLYNEKAYTNMEIPVIGKHNVYNSLAAFAVGTMLGLSDEEIREGVQQFEKVEKRLNIYDVAGITVIDDCYNASPESMRAALDVLISVAAKKSARPAALIGDMLELGDYSRLMHDELGQQIARKQVQKLFCFGSMADVVAEAAIKNGIRAENVCVVVDSGDPGTMADMILDTLGPGDVLLVKASRGIAAERVIEAMRNRQNKKK